MITTIINFPKIGFVFLKYYFQNNFFKNKINLKSCSTTITDSNYHIVKTSNFQYSFCYFSRINMYSGSESPGPGRGGIIFCFNRAIDMKINDCIFYKCGASVYSGCIYFQCIHSGTHSELIRNCINSCYSVDGHQFGNIQVHSSSKNIFDFISITDCNLRNNGDSSIGFYQGLINFTNFNSTNSLNTYSSIIHIQLPIQLHSIMCSFCNNTSTIGKCISLEGNLMNNMSYSNFINNKCALTYGILTILGGTYNLNNMIFINNINILFYVNSGKLIIEEFKISHNFNISQINSNGILFSYNIENIITNTFKILFLNTYLCENNFIFEKSLSKRNVFQFFLKNIIYFAFTQFI